MCVAICRAGARAMAHIERLGKLYPLSTTGWRRSRRAKLLSMGVRLRVVRIIRVEVGENARREAPLFSASFSFVSLKYGWCVTPPMYDSTARA
jgi:hypothetical protein